MILGYLILAHLIGDFILQPESLVKLKMKSVKGTLLHVFIHFIVGVAILAPFITHGYKWLILIIFAICFMHFVIDEAKINYELKHDKKVKPFIIDQSLHLLTILVAYFFVGTIQFTLPNIPYYKIYTNINFVMFFLLLIFSTAVIDMYRYQLRREKNANAKLILNSKKILKRIGVFAVIYALFMFFALYATKTF
ncbi:MAG: DUF3307 domain-containing protein [Candidatus Gracilibacteria bacterium]|jgi:hypothetical protein